jgi:hypothetical protein
MFIPFYHRVCGPSAKSLFLRQPTQLHMPTSKLLAAYHKQTLLFSGSSTFLPLETESDRFSGLTFKNLDGAARTRL